MLSVEDVRCTLPRFGFKAKHQGLRVGDVAGCTLPRFGFKAKQLARVSADGKEFTYSYLPNMPKLIAQSSCPLHTVTHVYEANCDVLTSKTNCWKNKVDNPIISGYTYIVNSLGQRTSVSTEGEAFDSAPADWAWEYDVLGQITSANGDHYSYDQIGNRRTSGTGDDADTTYTANALNQYALISTTVPTYDADGNQLTGLTPTESLPSRDTITFTYNAENRPVKAAQNGEVRESYSYDHNGRRIHKGDTVTLYDGYNSIAEYKSNTRTLKTTYAWGNDLSCTAQGAGGVGGLLSVTEHDRQLPLTSYPCYDGNGNITEYLTEEGTGIIAAHYEYDAFGQVSRKTGNRDYSYQFSTKPHNFLTGLNYYNYRDYDSISGRWINRDPIEENGGINLCSIGKNELISRIDAYGLIDFGGIVDGISGGIDSLTDLLDDINLGITYDPPSNSTVTPFELGIEWLTGLGPRQRDFVDKDAFAELMRSHEHIQGLKKKAEEKLKAQCQSCNEEGFVQEGESADYSLSGVSGIEKYVKDYSSVLTFGLTGNLAVTFSGSYTANVTVTDVNCCDGKAHLLIETTNNSTAASSIRPPYLGYTDFWLKNISPKINALFQSGPGSKTTQTVSLNFDLEFEKNKNCKGK